MRDTNRWAAGGLLATAVLCGSTACQSGQSIAAPGGSAATAATQGAAGTSSAAAGGNLVSASAAGQALSRCSATQLTITTGAGDSGMTHRSVVLIFTNVGPTACQMMGYPGVAAVNAQGTQIEQARRELSGYLGGTKSSAPPTVPVPAGQSASALVEALAVGSDGSACTPYAALMVTPPDETRSTKVAWPGEGCDSLTVHPAVPGNTGQLS